MTPEVRDALDNATTVGIKTDGFGPKKHRSTAMVRQIVYAVIQELDSTLTLGELCDELCSAANQKGEE